jgi:hypothetical protein
MKKLTVSLAAILISTFFFSGCQYLPQSTSTPATSTEETATGSTTLTGTLQSSNGKYFLKSTGKTVELDSYSVEFTEFVGKNVSITGQYSGDTLFAESITEQQ